MNFKIKKYTALWYLGFLSIYILLLVYLTHADLLCLKERFRVVNRRLEEVDKDLKVPINRCSTLLDKKDLIEGYK